MFMSLATDDLDALHTRLGRNPFHREVVQGKTYVGWNVDIINRGNYFYAFSHSPLHELNLPRDTFRIVCFRDPVKRVVSHYNMIHNYLKNNVKRAFMQEEGKWLGASFNEFIHNMPVEALMNQLYMFSSKFNVREATSEVEQMEHIMFTEGFQQGVEDLNHKTGLELKVMHSKNNPDKPRIDDKDLDTLRELLQPEYEMLNAISRSRVN